jgi:hypothetical protein
MDIILRWIIAALASPVIGSVETASVCRNTGLSLPETIAWLQQFDSDDHVEYALAKPLYVALSYLMSVLPTSSNASN